MRFILLPGITNIPLWAKPETTIGDLFCRAADLQYGTQAALDLNRILNDPDYQPLLEQRIFQSGLLQDGVLDLFDPDRLINVIISQGGDAHRLQLPASTTVRDVKQQLKKQLPSEMRKRAFELLLTGSVDRPEGTRTLLALTRLPYKSACFDLVPKEASELRVPHVRSVNGCLFRKHLQQSRFQAGVDKGLWRLVSITWPHAVIALRVNPKDSIMAEQYVRFRLEHYPTAAPAIEFWDSKHRNTVPVPVWPDWFARFVTVGYPQLVTLDAADYDPRLLHLSISVARFQKRRESKTWNPAADITQVLAPLVGCLFGEDLEKSDSNADSGAIRGLVSQQQPTGSRKEVSVSH